MKFINPIPFLIGSGIGGMLAYFYHNDILIALSVSWIVFMASWGFASGLKSGLASCSCKRSSE